MVDPPMPYPSRPPREVTSLRIWRPRQTGPMRHRLILVAIAAAASLAVNLLVFAISELVWP